MIIWKEKMIDFQMCYNGIYICPYVMIYMWTCFFGRFTQLQKHKKQISIFLLSYLEIRLTAPDVVRGGKNSSENQWSPDSIRRFILSRSRSVRSASSTGVEHLELSLELSPLLLAPLESLLEDCQPMSALWFTMFPVPSVHMFIYHPKKKTEIIITLSQVDFLMFLNLSVWDPSGHFFFKSQTNYIDDTDYVQNGILAAQNYCILLIKKITSETVFTIL